MNTGHKSQVLDIYIMLDMAVCSGKLIERTSRRDKEFHFQDWFETRLDDAGVHHERGGRNSYPDFRLVNSPDGFEIKGLAYPGRESNYDANSQVPSGFHNGRTIYYCFGRYPKDPEGTEYPVIDLVLCHGDLINADHSYTHKNRSVKAFGSYGDILIRDRKMYVAPTPFAILDGTAGRRTLVLPSSVAVHDQRLKSVGRFTRVEVDKVLVAYEFDLKTNELTPRFADNPSAGKRHEFTAYRAITDAPGTVSVKDSQ